MKLVKAAGLKPLISLIPLFLLGLVLVVLARMIDAADKQRRRVAPSGEAS